MASDDSRPAACRASLVRPPRPRSARPESRGAAGAARTASSALRLAPKNPPNSGGVRWPTDRGVRFSFENAYSIGFGSGRYGGSNRAVPRRHQGPSRRRCLSRRTGAGLTANRPAARARWRRSGGLGPMGCMSDVDGPKPGTDPFGPPAVPTRVGCLHCQQEYESYRTEPCGCPTATASGSGATCSPPTLTSATSSRGWVQGDEEGADCDEGSYDYGGPQAVRRQEGAWRWR